MNVNIPPHPNPNRIPVYAVPEAWTSLYVHTVDGCEILHQFIGGLSHYFQASTIPGGAGFLPSTVSFSISKLRWPRCLNSPPCRAAARLGASIFRQRLLNHQNEVGHGGELGSGKKERKTTSKLGVDDDFRWIFAGFSMLETASLWGC